MPATSSTAPRFTIVPGFQSPHGARSRLFEKTTFERCRSEQLALPYQSVAFKKVPALNFSDSALTNNVICG
jgi:hypothetical protein